MAVWRRLERRAAEAGLVRVAVVGAGFIGRGLVAQLARTPGLAPVLVVNRTPERAVAAYAAAGLDEPVVTDDPPTLAAAVEAGTPAVTSAAEAVAAVDAIDLVVEATGAMEYGGRVVLDALAGGKDVVSMNAELDATLGYLLHHEAARAGRIYTIADGDQPGVLLRQLEFVQGLGLEIVAALNCKRNLDVHQDPDDSRPYAERDGTSVLMTTAFGDGTKMQIENAVVANLTGLVPDRRGMHGVETTLKRAIEDVVGTISRPGVVEYTLGGDFGGGVAVIGRTHDRELRAYLKYGKLGDGPDFLFFRPYHLIHLEIPLTIADVVLDREPLGTPVGPPVADVVAVAKRDLAPGTGLDGIGGYACYGAVATAEEAAGYLPIGLAGHARAVAPVARDEPVPLDAVELDEEAWLVTLRRRQDELVRAGAPAVHVDA
jgi:predicted homoserine dehydrogenase-like protein